MFLGCGNVKKRIISAIIMLIIVVPLLIIGGFPFRLAVSILSVFSLYEIFKVREKEKQIPLVLKIFGYLFIFLLLILSNSSFSLINFLDFRIIALLLLIFLIPIVLINNQDKYNINDAFYMIASILFISFSYIGFIAVRSDSILIFIYLILISTMNDVFALVTGMLVGKHKLCESISPKKTIEGSVGGLLVGTIIPVLFYTFVIDTSCNLVVIILITIVLSIIGQLGDLLFSSIKRHFGVKDFSKLIPGHGGILDRLDSLILIVLAYLLLVSFL